MGTRVAQAQRRERVTHHGVEGVRITFGVVHAEVSEDGAAVVLQQQIVGHGLRRLAGAAGDFAKRANLR
jgi:hypothetical protein